MKSTKPVVESKRKAALNDSTIKKELTRLARAEKAVAKQKQVFTRTLGLANAQAALGREAAYNRMREKAFKELDKLNHIRTKFEQDSITVKFKFLKKFELPESQQQKLIYDRTDNPKIDSNLRGAFKTLERHLHPDIHSVAFDTHELQSYVKNNYSSEHAKQLAKAGRSFVQKNVLALSEKAPPIVVIHEFGHLVENNTPNVLKMAQGFLTNRVGDEPLTNLRDRYGDTFGSNETGRKDNFDQVFSEKSAHYVGKHYSDGGTEVIAMGFEQFFTDPIKFAKKDPEYFNFVVGIMHGDFK